MNLDHLLVLGILGLAVVLFITEWLRVDLVALVVLCALIVTGLITPVEALSGFSNPAVITVWAVFIMSGGLFYSGVADAISQSLLRLAGRSQVRLLVLIMITAGLMSAVMNNIGAVAILLPAVVSIARQINVAPSKLLMPLAFASLLGGNITLIGTPPNLLASDIMAQYGNMSPFGFFDFTPMGFIALAAGIVYMVGFGRFLLPIRTPLESFTRNSRREYTSEVSVSTDSNLVGKPAQALTPDQIHGLTLLHLRRGDQELTDQNVLLQADDVLTLRGAPRDIVRVSQRLKLIPTIWDYDQFKRDVVSGTRDVVEVTLSPDSSWDGHTLKEDRFRDRYGLTVLAIRHHGKSLVSQLGKVPLAFGDSFLVEGTPDKIDLLRSDGNFLLLDTPPIEKRRLSKAPLALFILLATVVVASIGRFNVATTFIVGATAMVLSGALTMDEAYDAIDWRSVFLIAGMLPLGIAMEQSGTATLLANQIIRIMGAMGPMAVLIGIFLLTTVLTAVMSNAAATVLLVPIAIDAALNLGVAPQPFVMATVLAASNSFMLPVGHQVNIIILGASGYKVIDYVKVGFLLNVIMLILVILVLPLIWPL